jgi:hypothetical protein
VRRIAGLDLVAVLVADPRHLTVDLPLEAGQAALGLELGRRDLAEHRARAVGEHGRQLDHVLDRQAVRDRVRAARVVAEHPAERCAVRRRGVRAEAETQRSDVMIQVVLHEPRLHAHPELLGVDLEHLVHVAREVEDEGVVDGLARQRRAAAPRQDRDLVLGGDLDRGAHVVGVARDHHADRLHLVHRGVGRVEETGGGVEPDVAADRLAEFAFEVVHGGPLYSLLAGRSLRVL